MGEPSGDTPTDGSGSEEEGAGSGGTSSSGSGSESSGGGSGSSTGGASSGGSSGGGSASENSGSSGAASFYSRQQIYGKDATAVDWGDFDQDGDLDLFVIEGGKHAGGRKILAWFEAPSWTRHDLNTAIGPFTGDCEAVDIDQDGDLDIITSYDRHSGSASVKSTVVWYENVNPFSTWPQHVIESDVPNSQHIGDLKVGDLDKDGKRDVVIRHLGTPRIVVYYQNNSDSWSARRLDVRPREGLFVRDLDGDGRDDLIANGFVLFAPSSRSGTFEELTLDAAYYSLPNSGLNNSVKIDVADFSGDGRPDVLFSVAEGASVYMAWYKNPSQPRSQSWARHMVQDPISKQHQAEVGDIDLDGDLDIYGGYSFGSKGVFWWENKNGQGTSWQRHTIDADKGCYHCEAADFDGDGDLDFAGPETYTGRVYLYENATAN